MTSEPLRPECDEVRQRLAEGDGDRVLLDHMASCEGCSAFAAALVELEARLARLPRPEPPAGAADRAVSRFRAEIAAHGSAGTAPVAHSAASPPMSGPPRMPVPPSSSAGTGPPSRGRHASQPRSRPLRRRQWSLRVSLAAGVAAAIALVVALVAVFLPGSAPPAYAAVLHEAAAHTGAERSARFDISGAIGFTVRGQKVTAPLSGTGATQFPDRGELTEVETIFGRQLRQDIVSVGNQVWTRLSDGKWALVPIPPDHASPVDQALDYPARALEDLARVGSGDHSLRTTTVDGTRVRQIQVTIPGDAYHAFGNFPEQVSHWKVVVALSQEKLILRRLTITGRGVVSVLGVRMPFTYALQLTLRDFGASVSIQPPTGGASPGCAHCKPGSKASPSASTPTARRGSSTAAPGSGHAPSGSSSPTPGGSKSSAPGGSKSPSPSPTATKSASPSPTRTTPAPDPSSTCVQTAGSAASPRKPCSS
jgi:hypothetical protein